MTKNKLAKRVCLDIVYFAENWKLIAENIVAKYFFYCRVVPWEQCHTFFITWLVYKQCHGTSQVKCKYTQKATLPLCKCTLSVRLVWMKFAGLFYYSTYFCYYLWVSLHFLALFMDLTVLFQLTFTFIYSTFIKKIQFQQNKRIPNRP